MSLSKRQKAKAPKNAPYPFAWGPVKIVPKLALGFMLSLVVLWWAAFVAYLSPAESSAYATGIVLTNTFLVVSFLLISTITALNVHNKMEMNRAWNFYCEEYA